MPPFLNMNVNVWTRRPASSLSFLVPACGPVLTRLYPFLIRLSFPFSIFLCLTKHFHLQIMEDYAKGGCKNGYLRHMDSSILGHDGVPTPGIPRDQSLEDELLHVLDTFFQKKATVSLESR